MNKAKHLKIGMDFHGVINRDPAYFKRLADELIRRGHEVHVITGGPCNVIAAFLKQINFPYTQAFAILDHYEGLGIVEHRADGSFHVDDELWDSAKAQYCLAQKIDLHIDDSMEYLRYFITPYCLYDASSNRCAKDHEPCLDFAAEPAEIIYQLEKMFLK